MIERIAGDWQTHAGHVDRYRWAAGLVNPGERVNDIACGIGYGSTCFADVEYHGYDRPDVWWGGFDGTFHACDLNDPDWAPGACDVTVCFETLEHVETPAMLAAKIDASTARAVFLSVPTRPTRYVNPFHLHDFTVDDIPPMFPSFDTVECWDQPTELSHVWHLERR